MDPDLLNPEDDLLDPDQQENQYSGEPGMETPAIQPPDIPQGYDYQQIAQDELGTPQDAEPFEYNPDVFTGAQQAGNQFSDYASQAMQAPSRYDTPLLQTGVDVINQAIDKQRQTGQASMDEFISQRGLVGSGVEANQRRLFEEDLQRQSGEQYFNLLRDQATTFAQDRSVAGQLGAQNVDLQRGLGLDVLGADEREAAFNRQLGRDTEADRQARAGLMLGATAQQEAGEQFGQQFELSAEIQRRSQELQAQGLDADTALREAQLELQRSLGLSELDIQQQSLGLQGEVQRRALELQEQGMEIDAALRQAQLEQERAQFEETIALDAEIQRRSQELQAQGLDADTALREAQLELQRSLGLSDLDIRQQSLDLQSEIQRLNAALEEARVTGDLDGQQTLEAQIQQARVAQDDQRIELARRELDLQDELQQLQARLQEAELTGQLEVELDDGTTVTVDTLRAITEQRALDLEELSLQQEDQRAQQELELREMLELGEQDLQARALDIEEEISRLQTQLQQAELTGDLNGVETLEAEIQRAEQELAVAEITGLYQGQETFQAEVDRRQTEVDELRAALAEAEVTGNYQGNETLSAELDRRSQELQQMGLQQDTALEIARLQLQQWVENEQLQLQAQQSDRETQLALTDMLLRGLIGGLDTESDAIGGIDAGGVGQTDIGDFEWDDDVLDVLTELLGRAPLDVFQPPTVAPAT